MEQHDKNSKIAFSTKAAWVGLIAYVVLIVIVMILYMIG